MGWVKWLKVYRVNVWPKHKFKIPLFTSISDMLTCHQRNLLFLLFSHDVKYYITHISLYEKSLQCSPTTIINSFIRLRHLPLTRFLHSLKVLPNCKIQGSVRVYNSILKTRDSFDQISNEILCVNSFLIFLPTLNF